MAPIRSLLWIGRGDELGCGVVADAPSVEVAWAAGQRIARTGSQQCDAEPRACKPHLVLGSVV